MSGLKRLGDCPGESYGTYPEIFDVKNFWGGKIFGRNFSGMFGEGHCLGNVREIPGGNCPWECQDSRAGLQVSTCSGYDFVPLWLAHTHTQKRERQREILAAYTTKHCV